MMKYKINLKFKEDGKSLNELLTDVLKIELKKYIAVGSLFKITGNLNEAK